jgi:UDP-3-O-[3-hydroxymyristoyl] glucosamine N-acyltransferase
MSQQRATTYTVEQIATAIGARMASTPGLGSALVNGIGTVHTARADDVAWLGDIKHAKSLEACIAGAVVGPEKLLGSHPRALIVKDTENAMAVLLELFCVPYEQPAPGIHATAILHPSAQVHPNAKVGAYATLGEGVEVGEGSIIHEGVRLGAFVKIGTNTTLYDNCVVYDRCEIRNNVIIHAGVVIGADGFGYIFREGRHRKLLHLGSVLIEDEVEICPNATIARGKTGNTIIGRGTKIDSMVVIAHNVELGPLCMVAGQVGLAGSVKAGTGVYFGGQSGVVNGVCIGDGAKITAQACLISDLEAGAVVSGMPAFEHSAFLRMHGRMRRLDDLAGQVAKLSRRIAQIEAATDHPKPG